MLLSTADKLSLSVLAENAAIKAGQHIQRSAQGPFETFHKSSGSSSASQIITEVDRQAQEIILDILLPSCDEFDLGLLTEESADDGSRFEKDFFWCIDPLDGTLPFSKGREGYAVSIALVTKEGEAIIGIVYDPVKCNLYCARKGEGVTQNGLPFQFAKRERFHFVSDKSLRNSPEYPELLLRFQNLAAKKGLPFYEEELSFGAVMSVLSVIEMGGGVFCKPTKEADGCGSIWDYAATACIFQELGYHVTAYDGSPLNLNSRETTFMNRQGVLFSAI